MAIGTPARRALLTLLAIVGTAPAFAQATREGIWLVDSVTGCKVWNAVPDPGDGASWSGPCIDGFAEGSGTLQMTSSGKPVGRYDGTYKAGKMNGSGVFAFNDGHRYEGGFVDNKHSGKGIQVFPNGNRYQGEYRDGRRNGMGVFIEAGGSRYAGGWRDDVPDGLEVFAYGNGDRYEGDVVMGQPGGRGLFVSAKGERYDGEWKDGMPNGQGKKTGVDGAMFDGTWTNGCFRDGQRTAVLGATAKACGFE